MLSLKKIIDWAVPDTIDELVFEQRNKTYGAYDLRKSYATFMSRGMLIAMLLCLLLFVVFVIRLKDDNEQIYMYDPVDLPVDMYEPPQLETPKIKGQQEVEVELKTPDDESTPTKVVRNEVEIIPSETKNQEPKSTEPEKQTQAGTTSGTKDEGSNDGSSDKGTSSVTSTGVVSVPSVMPSYPGGKQALLKFMKDNVDYPYMAKNLGIEGTVMVQFVVTENGDIADIKVIKPLGAGCDEEAVRVIQLMPKWNPGLLRDKPIKVRFTMPVTFNFNKKS